MPLSVIKRRISQLSSGWCHNSILHYTLRFIFGRVRKTNIFLTLRWVSLRHNTTKSNFADWALFNILYALLSYHSNIDISPISLFLYASGVSFSTQVKFVHLHVTAILPRSLIITSRNIVLLSIQLVLDHDWCICNGVCALIHSYLLW